MTDKTLRLTGTVIKADDLPDELKGAAEEADVWGYASVETIDRDTDIVRAKGIRTSLHRPESPIKLLAGHLRILPNGESPIIGRVTGFRQVSHKSLGVPALAFGAKFADTPLGKSYKALYADGCGPDFSIGFRPLKAEPLKDGGLDYQESELLEISAVTVPANSMATVLRAYEETYPESLTIKSISDHLVAMDVTLVHALASVEALLKDLAAQHQMLAAETKSILSRFDDIEDAIEGAPKVAEPGTVHTPPPSEKSESEPTPEQVTAFLAAIAKHLRK